MKEFVDILEKVKKRDWVEIVFVLKSRKKVQPDGKVRWFPQNKGIEVTVIQQGQGR